MRLYTLFMLLLLTGNNYATTLDLGVDLPLEAGANSGYESILVDYDDGGTFFAGNDIDKDTSVYQWGADLTSLYAFMEYGDPEVITGHEVDDDIKDDTLAFLEDAWNITDRKSAEEVIDRVITFGHESKYKAALDQPEIKAAIDAIVEDYGDSFSYEDAKKIDEEYFEDKGISTDEFYKVKGAACAYVRFGEDALIGYDYLRLVRVVSLCYQCGFLTEEEYSQLLYNMETALQKQFSSFEEIHETYYYGEMFRLKKKTSTSDETISDIASGIKALDARRYYQKIEKQYDGYLTLEHIPLITEENVGKGKEPKKQKEELSADLSDSLRDYQFQVGETVYQLPLTFKQLQDSDITLDEVEDKVVKADEEYYFEGYYLDNQYSKLTFGVYNDTDKDLTVSELPIIYVKATIFGYNQFEKNMFAVAGGVELYDYYIKDLKSLFGKGKVADNEYDNGLVHVNFYEYDFDDGYYNFWYQPSGSIAGVEIIKY